MDRPVWAAVLDYTTEVWHYPREVEFEGRQVLFEVPCFQIDTHLGRTADEDIACP
jgi:hypothetical protein